MTAVLDCGRVAFRQLVELFGISGDYVYQERHLGLGSGFIEEGAVDATFGADSETREE